MNIQLIGKILLLPLLLAPYGLLVAMTSYPGFALQMIGILAIFSWWLIWSYAHRKVREDLNWLEQLLFVPLWMVSGPMGLVLWILVDPVDRIKQKRLRDRLGSPQRPKKSGPDPS